MLWCGMIQLKISIKPKNDIVHQKRRRDGETGGAVGIVGAKAPAEVIQKQLNARRTLRMRDFVRPSNVLQVFM